MESGQDVLLLPWSELERCTVLYTELDPARFKGAVWQGVGCAGCDSILPQSANQTSPVSYWQSLDLCRRLTFIEIEVWMAQECPWKKQLFDCVGLPCCTNTRSLVWDLTGLRRWSNNPTPVGKYQRQDESHWCHYEDAGPFMGLL